MGGSLPGDEVMGALYHKMKSLGSFYLTKSLGALYQEPKSWGPLPEDEVTGVQ